MLPQIRSQIRFCSFVILAAVVIVGGLLSLSTSVIPTTTETRQPVPITAHLQQLPMIGKRNMDDVAVGTPALLGGTIIQTELPTTREAPISQRVARNNEAKHREIFEFDHSEVPAHLPEDVLGDVPALSEVERNPPIDLYDAPTKAVVPSGTHRSVYCILSTPQLVHTRLLPLLTTSLRDAPIVLVFLRKTNISHLAVVAVDSALKEQQGPSYSAGRVRVIEVEGPNSRYINKPLFVRNSWLDLEVIRFLGQEYLGPQLAMSAEDLSSEAMSTWFTIIDDDSYLLTPAVKAALHSATQLVLKATSQPPASFATKPILVGRHLLLTRKGFRRVKSGGRAVKMPRATAPPGHFAAGGGGISFNMAALATIYSKSIYHACIAKYLHGGGDIRLSKCLLEEGKAVFINNDCFSWDTPMRGLGEQRLDTTSAFPCSFHRMRHPSWYYRLSAIEKVRSEHGHDTVPRQSLVWWEDLRMNFKSPQFWDSQFFPRKYDNFTVLYFGMTKAELANINKRRGLPPDEDLF